MKPNEQKTEQVANSTGKELFSEAVLIAGLTAAGYLTACAYQLAYLDVFNIPRVFLSVDSTMVLFTVLALLAWITAVIVITSLLVEWKITKWVRIPVMILAELFLVIFPFLLLILDPKYPLLSIIGIPTVIIIIVLWIKNLQKHNKNNTEPQDGFTKILNFIDEIFGTPRTLIGFAAFLFILLGAGFGRISAQMQEQFLVPSTDPNVAIITTYKDSFVGLVFDVNTKKLSRQIVLINQNNTGTSTVFNKMNLSK